MRILSGHDKRIRIPNPDSDIEEFAKMVQKKQKDEIEEGHVNNWMFKASSRKIEHVFTYRLFFCRSFCHLKTRGLE
jgi:hypothetical protein